MSETKQQGLDRALGEDLIALLSLHVKRNGRVDTRWGDKTPLGLGATVRRVVRNNEGLADPTGLAELVEAAEAGERKLRVCLAIRGTQPELDPTVQALRSALARVKGEGK